MNNVEGSNVSDVRTADAVIFFTASLFALAAVFFPLTSFAASSLLLWGSFSADNNIVTIEDGGTYPVTLNTTQPVTIQNQALFSAYGNLYFLPGSTGTNPSSRVFIGTFGGYNGTQTLAWHQAGRYELDVYDEGGPTVDYNWWQHIRNLFGAPAYAQTAPAPFDIIYFTITDANAAPGESNVLFIPGTESSRLYQKPAGKSEQQVWEPNALSNQPDVVALDMHADGTSISPTYTKANGAIDTYGFSPLGIPLETENVYKTFLQQLAALKASSTIADYAVFPYDWRFSPEDVVNKGTQYDDGTHYIDQALIALAATSKTGKVTIVAHSNGGLVAKALMIKLQSEGKANLVDKILFVAVPQTGAPKDIAVMLNGDLTGIPGFVVSQATARGLAENMPDAYDLLPSAAYFASVASPVVDLSSAPALRAGSGVSNGTVTSAADFRKFLLGAGGRTMPIAADIEMPVLLSSSLLSSAVSLHNDLDSWQPPAGVQVIQIAGWGVDTPSGIVYSEISQPNCAFILTCTIATTTRHTVNLTEDGDGTVEVPSAVANATWPTYYININKYVTDKKIKFDHSDITEMPAFQNLFSLLLSSSSPQTMPAYVTTSEPTPTSADKSLRLRVLSPVTLDVYDSAGNHTGMAPNPSPYSNDLYIQEQIPGSYYQQYGEGQYVGLPADGTYTVKLHGTDTGTFTYEITPVSGGVAGTPITFAGIPVTASSTATMSLSGSNPAASTLTVDENGDGKADMTFASSTQTTDPAAYTKLIGTTALGMDIGLIAKLQIEAKLYNVGYLIARSSMWDLDDGDPRDTNTKAAVKTRVLNKLNLLETYVETEVGKPSSKLFLLEKVTAAQAQQILGMIETLKTIVNTKL